MTKPALRTDADFDAFYERNWKYVFRLCFTYLKRKADAEDCAEDVFVKVLTGNRTFADRTHERKWLTITAINLCKDKLKRFENKNVRLTDDGALLNIEAPEGKEETDGVKEAVLALSPIHKDVIWLYYYEDYSTDEIAALLKCPPSTVRNRLADARKKLKVLLGGAR